MERGVRQGCPLSVYLFLLVVELLAIQIRQNNEIKGIQLSASEIVISQLADDTSIFLKDPRYIASLLRILTKFAICSGLKTNVEKTKVHNLGQTNIEANELEGMTLEQGPIKLLGITLTNSEKESIEENFLPKLKVMKNLLNQWSQRSLSLKGKITVINSLIISLFIYPITIIETPPTVLDEIDEAITHFLWGGKQPKIAKGVIEKQIEDGGLKMPNIYIKAKAWKSMWLKRASLNPQNNWVYILNELLGAMTFNHFILCSSDKRTKLLYKLPKFYHSIILDWYKLSSDKKYTNVDIQNEVLWYNTNITIEKNMVFWKHWYDKGVLYVKDILDENANFMNHEAIKNKYGINTNFLETLQLRQALPYGWRNYISTANSKPIEDSILTLYNPKDKKNSSLLTLKSKDVYWIILNAENSKFSPKCISKWNKLYNFDDLDWKHIYRIPFSACRDTELQSFQYKLINRIIACRHWLYNLKVVDSPQCLYCQQDDNLPHFFIDCEQCQMFWISFSNWWHNLTKKQFPKDRRILLFGIPEYSPFAEMLNFCLIFAKWYIYKAKIANQSKISLSLYKYLNALKERVQLEYVYFKTFDKLNLFTKKWGFLHENL